MSDIFTSEQRAAMIANHVASTNEDAAQRTMDHFPVVRLFTPDANAVWLLTEIDEGEGMAFGLCDLGMGSPELGYVSLQELKDLRGRWGLAIERDLAFVADKPLSLYARLARLAQRIVI